MKLLIIEDDPNLSDVIRQCVAPFYQTEQAFDGEEGLYYASQNIYDLILLDLMLPLIDGYEVLRQLREQKIYTPVLILTARGTMTDKTKGFRTGADDYLVKPFDRDELLLRIEAILRRSTGHYDIAALCFKELRVETMTRTVTVAGEALDLRGKQYDILEYLVSHQEQLVTKAQIFDKILGFTTDTSSNVVEVYVSALRRILSGCGYDSCLKTIRGVGYMLTSGEKAH